MRVFVAGGTGVIGRRAVARLIEAGHDVTALSRRVESDESLRAASATPVRVDLFDSNGLESVLSGHDAVVNVATAIPSLAQAIKPSSWETNNRIRREGAATLAAAAAAAGVTRYVQESVSFDYRDGGDSWVCEDHPRDLELAGPGESAERAAREFPGDGIILRFAQFVSPDSGHVRSFARYWRWHVSPLLGSREGYTSFVHADDAAAAVVAALEAPPGTYNIAETEPARRQDIDSAVASALGQRLTLRIPPALLRRMDPNTDPIMRSHRIDSDRFRELTGWAPNHPSATSSLPTIVKDLLR